MAREALELQPIFASLFRMIAAHIGTISQAKPMVDAAAAYVAQLPEIHDTRTPSRLPVCDCLPQALHAAKGGGSEASVMADLFAALAPNLDWRLRAGAADHGDRFLHGHANALIFGHGDYAVPEKMTLGVSVMAPRVTYPDHSHPPEELYIVLSSGRWRQNKGPWTARGPGELVHNPPGINHGMQAGEAPLLALWLLWNG
jgi:quercetin dioxygenase-like cupin family protein